MTWKILTAIVLLFTTPVLATYGSPKDFDRDGRGYSSHHGNYFSGSGVWRQNNQGQWKQTSPRLRFPMRHDDNKNSSYPSFNDPRMR